VYGRVRQVEQNREAAVKQGCTVYIVLRYKAMHCHRNIGRAEFEMSRQRFIGCVKEVL